MNKSVKVLLSMAFAASAAAGCTGVDTGSPDYSDDPGYIVFSKEYVWQVNNFFRCAEIVDFFDRYQGIREDRDASEKLAGEYFGDAWDELYYEKVKTPDGVCYSLGNGSYRFEPCYTPVFDSDFSMDATVKDGLVMIECASGMVEATAVMRVDGDTVYMESLRSLYREKDTGDTMSVATDDASCTVSLPRCGADGVSYVPDCGELAVEIRGEGIADSFRVVFDSDRTGVSRPGSMVVYYKSPEPYYDPTRNYR